MLRGSKKDHEKDEAKATPADTKNKEQKENKKNTELSAEERHQGKKSKEHSKGKDKDKPKGSGDKGKKVEKQDEEEDSDSSKSSNSSDEPTVKKVKNKKKDSDEVENGSTANKHNKDKVIPGMKAITVHAKPSHTHETHAKKGKDKSNAAEKGGKKDNEKDTSKNKAKEKIKKAEDKAQIDNIKKSHNSAEETKKKSDALKPKKGKEQNSKEEDGDYISVSSSSEDNAASGEHYEPSMNFKETSIKSLEKYEGKDLEDIRYVRWISGGTEYTRAIIAVQFAFLEALQRKEKGKFIGKLKSVLALSELFKIFGEKLNNLFSQLDKNKPYELVESNKATKNIIGDLLLRTILLSEEVKEEWSIDKKEITGNDWKEIAKRLMVNIEVFNAAKKKTYKPVEQPILKQSIKLLMAKKLIGILYTPRQAFSTGEITEDNIRGVDNELTDLKGNPVFEKYVDFILSTSNKLLKTLKEDVDVITDYRESLDEAVGDSYKTIEKDLDKKIKEFGNTLRQYQSKRTDYCRFLYTLYYSE